MSAPIFIDTGYVLALVNSADRYHERARATAKAVDGPFAITEAVLVEIGNALSRTRWRQLAVDTLRDLCTDPGIEVIPVDAGLFERAFELYASRTDQE